MGEHVLQRPLRVGRLEPLAAHPRDLPPGPGRLAVGEDAAVAQPLPGDPVSHGGARATQILSAAHQVAQALPLRRRRRHERQLADAIQTHRLLGVTPIGLDAIARAHRHQRRRDHVTRHTQPAPAAAAGHTGTGLPQRRPPAPRPAQPVDPSPDHALAVIDAPHPRRPAARRQRRRDIQSSCTSSATHIRRRRRANLRQGPALHSYAALADTAHLTATTPTRNRRKRREPARNLRVHPD
jgi:hypothetical protein